MVTKAELKATRLLLSYGDVMGIRYGDNVPKGYMHFRLGMHDDLRSCFQI